MPSSAKISNKDRVYFSKNNEKNKCRLYPALAGYTTRYIPRERARSTEVEEAPRAKPEALSRLHESASPFPRDITGRTSRQHVI